MVPTVLWVSHCKVIARYIDCQVLTELCVICSTNFSNSGGRGLHSHEGGSLKGNLNCLPFGDSAVFTCMSFVEDGFSRNWTAKRMPSVVRALY